MVTRSRVDATSFDVSQGRGSQPYGSTSRGHMSPTYEAPEDALEAPEAYEVNQEDLVADADAPVDSYSGGPFDTSLLHLY